VQLWARVRERGCRAAHGERDAPVTGAPATETEQARYVERRMYANGCERPSSRTRSVAGAEEGARAARHCVHLDASDGAPWENKSGRTYGVLCSGRFCFAFTPAAAPAHVGNGSVSRRVRRRPRARCTLSSKRGHRAHPLLR
jgi:hypothetical protein